MTSIGEVDSRKSHFEEDKEGFTGRAGYDPRGSSVTGSPSIPRIRGKGIILEGNCEIPGAENMEESQPFSSQPPEPSCFPFYNLEKLLPSPSCPHLPNSAFLSQSSMVNQGNSKIFSEKGVVNSLNYVGIPVRAEDENQRAFSNQLSESSTPRKSSNLMSGSPGDTVASSPGDFLIDGLSPRKMAKMREVLCSLDIKVYSRRKNRGPIGD